MGIPNEECSTKSQSRIQITVNTSEWVMDIKLVTLCSRQSHDRVLNGCMLLVVTALANS